MAEKMKAELMGQATPDIKKIHVRFPSSEKSYFPYPVFTHNNEWN